MIFVRFFPFFPASGWKYRILTMHKKQSVKNANICKRTILRYARNERVATMDELKGIRNLSLLDNRILSENLEPIPFKHPVANNKYEALSWCFKHEMWHSAEMEAIKRALGHPAKWM